MDMAVLVENPRLLGRWLGRLETAAAQPVSHQLGLLAEDVRINLEYVATLLRVWSHRGARPSGMTEAWIARTQVRVQRLLRRFAQLDALDSALRAQAQATALHVTSGPAATAPAWEVEISYQEGGQHHSLRLPAVPHDVALGLQLALNRYPVIASSTPVSEAAHETAAHAPA